MYWILRSRTSGYVTLDEKHDRRMGMSYFNLHAEIALEASCANGAVRPKVCFIARDLALTSTKLLKVLDLSKIQWHKRSVTHDSSSLTRCAPSKEGASAFIKANMAREGKCNADWTNLVSLSHGVTTGSLAPVQVVTWSPSTGYTWVIGRGRPNQSCLTAPCRGRKQK
eukprot:1227375-Amphidinium_carterae.1